jgi:hypothetical protein
MLGRLKPKYLMVILDYKKVAQKLVEDKFDATNVAVYFEKKTLPQDPYFRQ